MSSGMWLMRTYVRFAQERVWKERALDRWIVDSNHARQEAEPAALRQMRLL